jgi:hypothetical protein
MDATEKLAQMMIRCGLATGHGDTIDDLIFELEKQIKNTRLANSDLQMWFDYAKTEHDKLKAEVQRLRGSLQFDIMRRGLGCIADSDDVSVPNYVRQFARVLLGDE